MLLVHFGVGFGLTGSWQFGSALALIDLVLGVLIFYYHDRFWSLKVMFGKKEEEHQPEASLLDHRRAEFQRGLMDRKF
jgi:uncharacterized membrane protein